MVCAANWITSGTPGISVAVGGYLYMDAWPGMTATQKQDGVNSRNLFVSTLKNNPSLLSTTIPNAVLNTTCDASWVPGTTNVASDIKTVAGIPLGTCRIAPLGLQGDPSAPAIAQLQFPSGSSTTVDTFGIDNGKICAAGAGFISPATQNSRTVLTTIGTGSTATDGTLSCVAFTGICTLQTATGALNVLNDVAVGQTFTLSAGSPPALTMTGCASAGEASSVVTRLLSGPANPLGIFTIASVVPAGLAGTIITFQGFPAGTLCTTGTATATAGTALRVTGHWSPLCDNDNSYYLLNTVGATGLGGCPRCTTTTGQPTRFLYLGPNQGKFCSNLITKGIFGTPLSPMAAGLAGSSCILIGVSDLGSGSVDTGKPMVAPVYVNSGSFPSVPVATPPLPLPLPASSNPTYSNSISISSFFPNPYNAANPGRFNLNSVLDYNPSLAAGTGGTAAFKNVALDTQWGVPCSTPVISQPTNSAIYPMPIVGNVVLRAVGTPQLGAGSCNTMSTFYNGGTGVFGNNVTPDGYSAAILTSTFLANVIPTPPPPGAPVPAPAPAPFPAPAPAPRPFPAPAPAPFPVPAPGPGLGPAPSPSGPTITCIYTGNVLIESVVCPGRYMAFRNEKSQCKNSTVMLRTAKQSEGNRKIWRLDATATTGVNPAPSNIIAVGRITSCPTSSVTYLASANGPPTPRLAGGGWKFIITPVNAAAGCDTITLQAVGNNPYTGKYLGYGACTSQTAFAWSATGTVTSSQWKLTKTK